MDRLERLRQLRAAAMLNAERLPDDQAVKVPTMYEAWAQDTAARGMEYYKGKYYLDPNGKTYLCTRDRYDAPGSGIVLQYLPSELVGVYFEVA